MTPAPINLGELERLAKPKRKLRSPHPPAIVRAMSRVEYDTNGGCWLWTGRMNSYGYGRLHHNGRMMGAHRVTYEHFVGPIPDKLFVCHKCDVPACVNPDHLWLGTSADNTADKTRKGRAPRGESIRNAKLTEQDVLEILRSPEGIAPLARKYGTAYDAIKNIRIGKTWRHVNADD